MALLEGNKISISKRPMPLKLDKFVMQKTETEYKEIFSYTPNLKMPIVLSTQKLQKEIKSILYFEKNKMKLKVNVN